MKTNIVLIGFLDNLTKQISEKLALDFGLYYANAEDIIEYNLMNEKEIEKLCGVDYLNKLKQKTLKDISNYENTLITMPFSMFSQNNNYDMFKKNCTIVFLNFPKECFEQSVKDANDEKVKKAGEVFLIAYEERTQFCKDNSDVTINLQKPEFELSYKHVKKYLDDYYL